MDKKAFTLVELLAIIVILGVVSVIVVPSIVVIKNSVLENTKKSRISAIETAAIEYGYDKILRRLDTNCSYVTVEKLIESGYLVANNTYVTSDGVKKENQITDPTTGESLNNKRICIKFNNNDAMTREIIAYLIEE